ncbi:hypothetical protein ACFU6N_35695, partial [Streptomyces sp. NPDC057496]
SGLADPALRAAATACFGIALEALPRLGVTKDVLKTVTGFHDRFTARGRCPADDLPELLAPGSPDRPGHCSEGLRS